MVLVENDSTYSSSACSSFDGPRLVFYVSFTRCGNVIATFLLSLPCTLSIYIFIPVRFVGTTFQEPRNNIRPYDLFPEALLLQQLQTSEHGAWVREVFAVLWCAPVGVQVG